MSPGADCDFTSEFAHLLSFFWVWSGDACQRLGGINLRNLLTDYVRKVPADLRTILLPFVYGLFGGLAAVAFQKGASIMFSIFWEIPSQQMQRGAFAFFSLATILVASIIAGLLLTFVSRDAAGSGIPQVKVAFWRDFGFMPAKVVIAKFFAGAISIGGGCSLGREGPSVHIAGASNITGWLGVAKQGRRPALLSGAAAGLAAAFNTPLSAITFVLEEIIEDLNNRGFLAQVLIASVTATFVCHAILADNPAFVISSIGNFSGAVYLLVIPTAGLAAANKSAGRLLLPSSIRYALGGVEIRPRPSHDVGG
jgi:CIC family chloride channel protein